MEVTNSAPFGTISFGRVERLERGSGDLPATAIPFCQCGQWRPSPRLKKYLPDGLIVPLERRWIADDVRRTFVAWTADEMLTAGPAAGLAILHGLRGWNREVDHSYRAMFLIFQHVRGMSGGGSRGMHEHLARNFCYCRDLHVRALGRLNDGERDVLPDDVGLTAGGEGHRLTAAQLIESGRRSATLAGYSNPTNRLAIAYGLYEAARLRPLELRREEARALVRLALFDSHWTAEPSQELIDSVTERLLQAMHAHLDDSPQEFDRWFYSASNSLVKQLSQRKRSPGGKLDRRDVRQALLHLGWQAYDYVGGCLHNLMRTIKDSMGKMLDDEERRAFELMYESQPCFGGFPMMLLEERLDYLRPALHAIWQEPDKQEHARVLHRMLADYAAMAQNRREADRRFKARRRHWGNQVATMQGVADRHLRVRPNDRSIRRAPPWVISQTDTLDARAGQGTSGGMFRALRDAVAIDCPNRCSRWECRVEESSGDSVRLSLRCECGRTDERIRSSPEQLREWID
jgi:hypothetical protein